MDSDTILSIVQGAFLAGILIFIYVAHRRRRFHTKRLLMMELLKRYFQGDMPAGQLGQRAREIAHRHFMRSAEFYSMAVAAFQGAVDARLAYRAHSKEDERKLLGLLAGLKKEFGLTDLYHIEAWRAWRE